VIQEKHRQPRDKEARGVSQGWVTEEGHTQPRDRKAVESEQGKDKQQRKGTDSLETRR
jgi:hypothetical protein